MSAAFQARVARDLVVVDGPDATSFLQSLVSQDLDHSDNREVATVLAIVVNAAATGYGENFITELCDRVRHLREPEREDDR